MGLQSIELHRHELSAAMRAPIISVISEPDEKDPLLSAALVRFSFFSITGSKLQIVTHFLQRASASLPQSRLPRRRKKTPVMPVTLLLLVQKYTY